MSGLGAPARTETPRPASANGVTVSATTWPFLMRSVDLLGIARDQVGGSVGLEPLLQRGAGFLDDRHLVPARARERGRELAARRASRPGWSGR